MKLVTGIYLIVTAVVFWLWADGPLYEIGIVIHGRDLMGYFMPALCFANVALGAVLIFSRRSTVMQGLEAKKMSMRNYKDILAAALGLDEAVTLGHNISART
ncbi:MAG: hypothetical protein WA851_22115 [Xanthobacteraceae bacterium]